MKKIFLLVFGFLFSASCTHAQLIYQNLLVQYDSAWTYKSLQLIPVKFRNDADFMWRASFPKEIISLEEGLRTGKVQIKEMNFNRDADVDVLSIKNLTKKNILVTAGEVLTGGKQDRVVSETMIIPPGKDETYLNVYCVEKGRWDKKAKPFYHQGIVNMPLRKKIDIVHRQTEVWREIEQQFANQNKKTDNWPYVDLYRDKKENDSVYLNYFLNKLQRTDSVYAGFIVIAGKRIIGAEIFATPEYLLNHYQSMLISFIHSVLPDDKEPNVPHADIKIFSDALLQSEKSQNEFLATHGKADRYLNKTIHLIAYAD